MRPRGRRTRDVLTDWLGRTARPALRAISRAAILPDRGAARIPGLGAPVEVHFDDRGVPHIRARDDADAFRAQGYCHARDRFFQMDMLRRTLRGGLCEILGERRLGDTALGPFARDGTTLHADRLMRVLDLLPAARRVWDAGGTDGRALLQAYVDGVNAALVRMCGRRPLEHRLLRLRLESWTPIDSILIAKGMALGLSFKWRSAPVFGALAERLSHRPEHLEQILPPVPGAEAVAVTRCLRDGVGAALRFLPCAAPAVGSNAWVVGRGRTASGSPLLASDPHLEFGLPSVWYLASVSGDAFQAVGATLPGLPGVVIGRTPTIAWGLTNAMLDDGDLWVEELDARGLHYRVDGAWRALEVETQVIQRRGRSPEVLRVRRTHRGPLLTDAFDAYEGPPISVRLTLHEATQDMEAFLALGRARTTAEALDAAGGFGAPAQNLLLADRGGDAAYRMIGTVPRRAARGHPALPGDGTTTASDWVGTVPFEEIPAVAVGPQDQVVSANNPPVDATFPHYLSHLYEPPYRAARIHALLAGRGHLTAADMQRIQLDARSGAAERFRRVVLAPHAEAVRARRPALGRILDRVLAWQGDESRAGAGAAPWHLLYHHLLRRTFGTLLGERLLRHWMGQINLVDAALLAAFERADSAWAPPPVRATLLTEALEDAARDLAERGHDLDTPWGAMHTLTLRHPMGSVRALAATFQRGPHPLAGGPFSVCSGQHLHARPGPAVVGQSYRHVVDLAAPKEGRMITLGGQSGHVGSPHYDDLTPLWLAGQSLPMRLETVPANARVLRLEPS